MNALLITSLELKEVIELYPEDTDKILTEFRCPGCNKILTRGEHEYAGVCVDCYFEEVSKI